MSCVAVGSLKLDKCLAAPTPLDQARALVATLLPSPALAALDTHTLSAQHGGAGEGDKQQGEGSHDSLFKGQWARFTIFVEQAILPSPAASVPGLVGMGASPAHGTARSAGRYKYFCSYTLPGMPSKRATHGQQGTLDSLGLSLKHNVRVLLPWKLQMYSCANAEFPCEQTKP